MNLKKYACIGLVVASGTIGGYIGHKATLDREYRIIRDNNSVSLYVNSSSNSYPVIQHEGQAFVGDSEHHLMGVRIVANYEGMQETKPIIDELQNQVDTLERKIMLRKVTDGVEDLGASIKNGWRRLKHSTLN
jgi:hypothetical protein